jgi:hypothetical protein
MTVYILWKLTLSLSVRNIHIRLGGRDEQERPDGELVVAVQRASWLKAGLEPSLRHRRRLASLRGTGCASQLAA